MRIGEAAKILGVCVETLRNWEKAGKIPPKPRDLSGQRFYSKDEIDHIRALMGHGAKYEHANIPKKERKSTTKIPLAPVSPPLYNWEALYNLSDSAFWDWYHGKSSDEQLAIVKSAPEYLIYHIQRARSATSRPEEGSATSMGIMPPE